MARTLNPALAANDQIYTTRLTSTTRSATRKFRDVAALTDLQAVLINTTSGLVIGISGVSVRIQVTLDHMVLYELAPLSFIHPFARRRPMYHPLTGSSPITIEVEPGGTTMTTHDLYVSLTFSSRQSPRGSA
jgi:hypothetical protein